jgi:hypothetical protein
MLVSTSGGPSEPARPSSHYVTDNCLTGDNRCSLVRSLAPRSRRLSKNIRKFFRHLSASLRIHLSSPFTLSIDRQKRLIHLFLCSSNPGRRRLVFRVRVVAHTYHAQPIGLKHLRCDDVSGATTHIERADPCTEPGPPII